MVDLKKHKYFNCVAHNTNAYDAHFISKYCIENTMKPYTINSCSRRLMLLKIAQISLKIIDSMNFVQGPLSNFPKTVGLTELNTNENQGYIGPIPDRVL